MKNKVEKTKGKSRKYILLFLLVFLIALGIQKCPNRTENETKIELPQEKEDNLKLEEIVKSDAIPEEKNIPSTKNETRLPIEKGKSIILKSKKKNIPNININKEKKETTIPNKDLQKKEIIVHRIDENIEKRSPATSDALCRATTMFKINKASNQTSVAFSPDGSKFAVGNNNNYASVMDLNGKELFKLIGHKGYVLSIAYSPDGKYILTGSIDKTAKVWDANNGKVLKHLAGHTESIFWVSF